MEGDSRISERLLMMNDSDTSRGGWGVEGGPGGGVRQILEFSGWFYDVLLKFKGP